MPAIPDHPQIGFGGGCHWCTEAVFAALSGVMDLRQGFIRSCPPDGGYSEAVLLRHDPAQIPLEVLVEIHLRTHASTSDHKLRGKYRSAIYTVCEEQAREVTGLLGALQAGFPEKLVTRVLPFAGFRPSDTRFHGYAEKNAGNQFCVRYIDPKLDALRNSHGGFVKTA